jgi:hypothetical protein
MARPSADQWKPLGLDADPVPGDTGRISQEAAHLATVAKQIADQVAALKKIGAGGADAALKGQYADQIHSSANDLADQLDKVVGRYQKVSAALTGWIPDLEQAQTWSVQALNQAEAPYQQMASTPKPPTVTNPTAAQQQTAKDYSTSMTRAQGELDAAKALLNKATSLRDSSGSSTASKINSAIDDGVKDSWWDSFKEWVGHYAGVIKDICTVLEVIATILAVIALFIPGLDIIVILGIAATALALAGRTMLAATGNGSWFDVALDAFALLTFGFGKVIGNLMKGTFAATEDVAKGLIQAERDSSLLGKAGNLLGKASSLVENSPLVKGAVSTLDRVGLGKLGEGVTSLADKASGLLGKLSVTALEKASPSLEKSLATVSEDIKPLETALYGGEEKSLMMTRNMAAIAQRFPESPEIAQLGAKFNTQLNMQRGLFGVANTADQWDKWTGGLEWDHVNGTPMGSVHIPGTQFYRDFKDSWTTEGGLW